MTVARHVLDIRRDSTGSPGPLAGTPVVTRPRYRGHHRGTCPDSRSGYNPGHHRDTGAMARHQPGHHRDTGITDGSRSGLRPGQPRGSPRTSRGGARGARARRVGHGSGARATCQGELAHNFVRTHDTNTEHDFPIGGSITGFACPISDEKKIRPSYMTTVRVIRRLGEGVVGGRTNIVQK